MIALLLLLLLTGAAYATYLGIKNAQLEAAIRAYHADLARRGWTPEYTRQHWLRCMGRVN